MSFAMVHPIEPDPQVAAGKRYSFLTWVMVKISFLSRRAVAGAANKFITADACMRLVVFWIGDSSCGGWRSSRQMDDLVLH
jgi:hypothetical protein